MEQPIGIRSIRQDDFRQAVALTDLINWGFNAEDFSFMTKIEPEGCFVAMKNTDVIGLITSVSLGHMGWIGNVIVATKERKKGIGAALVKKALNHLHHRGVKTVGLYAYRKVVPFYENFGFKSSRDYSWLVCRKSSWNGKTMPKLVSRDLPAILEFDEQCFGAPRKRLLETIYEFPYSVCVAAFREGRPTAYLMAVKSSFSAEIGPWVCECGYEEEGFRLFKSLGNELAGLETHVGVPSDKPELVGFLSSLGFAEDFPVVRMYCGPTPVDTDCVLAMESLERG
jgi:GNAT superfamily N-acetyltransferase